MKAEKIAKTLGADVVGKMQEGVGLCYRCENRSMFHETGYGPRFECKQKRAVHACYCFMPCKPVAVAPVAREKRRIFDHWAIAGRVQAKGLVDAGRLRLKLVDVDGLSVAAVWVVKSKGAKKAK